MLHLTVMEALCLAAVLTAVTYVTACLRVLALNRRTCDGTTPQ